MRCHQRPLTASAPSDYPLRVTSRSRSLRLAALVAALTLNACTAVHSTLPSGPTLPAGAVFPNGPAVRLDAVNDRRDLGFELSSYAEANNPTFRERAVGAAGRYLHLLPPDTSVAEMVAKVVRATFGNAGYRVVKPGDEDYAAATPLSVDIDELWVRGYQGTWSYQLAMSTRLRLTAPATLLPRGGEVASTHEIGTYYPPAAQPFSGPRDSAWIEVLTEGCTALSQAIGGRIGP